MSEIESTRLAPIWGPWMSDGEVAMLDERILTSETETPDTSGAQNAAGTSTTTGPGSQTTIKPPDASGDLPDGFGISDGDGPDKTTGPSSQTTIKPPGVLDGFAIQAD